MEVNICSFSVYKPNWLCVAAIHRLKWLYYYIHIQERQDPFETSEGLTCICLQKMIISDHNLVCILIVFLLFIFLFLIPNLASPRSRWSVWNWTHQKQEIHLQGWIKSCHFHLAWLYCWNILCNDGLAFIDKTSSNWFSLCRDQQTLKDLYVVYNITDSSMINTFLASISFSVHSYLP